MTPQKLDATLTAKLNERGESDIPSDAFFVRFLVGGENLNTLVTPGIYEWSGGSYYRSNLPDGIRGIQDFTLFVREITASNGCFLSQEIHVADYYGLR